MSTVIDELITNRADGAVYNTTDLNRVGRAMYYVAERLRSCGFDVKVNPRTDWTRTDWPTPSAFIKYRKNLHKLHDTLVLFTTTPAVPADHDWLTPGEANDIEKILVDCEDMVERIMASYFYCGELYAGEV